MGEAPQRQAAGARTAKSKYSQGTAPKSNITKWEATQDGVKQTVDVVPAARSSIATTITSEEDLAEASRKLQMLAGTISGTIPDPQVGEVIKIRKNRRV